MSQSGNGETQASRGISRRDVFRTGAAAGVAAALGAAAAAPAGAAPPGGAPPGGGPPGRGDEALTFVNGKIHTMDGKGTVAKAVSIRNGRFVAVGNGAPNPGPGNRVINLKG